MRARPPSVGLWRSSLQTKTWTRLLCATESHAIGGRYRLCFEDVVFYITNGDVLDIIKHPNASRYPNQRIIVLNMDGYVYLVPYVEQKGTWFLKTIIPSRKATKEYLK